MKSLFAYFLRENIAQDVFTLAEQQLAVESQDLKFDVDMQLQDYFSNQQEGTLPSGNDVIELWLHAAHLSTLPVQALPLAQGLNLLRKTYKNVVDDPSAEQYEQAHCYRITLRVSDGLSLLWLDALNKDQSFLVLTQ